MDTLAPFGLRPSYHPSGTIRPEAGTITSTYGANIFSGSPVGIIADGSIALAAAGGTLITGACGAFQGCEYTPANGRRVVSNYWPSGQVATEIVAYYTQDPWILYEIQANATLTQAAIGGCYDWSANVTGSGSTGSGISSVTLDVASAANPAGLQVWSLNPSPINAWGDAFPVVVVKLNEAQFGAPSTGF